MTMIFILVALFLGVNVAVAAVSNGEYGDEKLGKKIRLLGNGLICLVFVVSIIFSSLYTISEQEVGFTETFGENVMIEGNGLKSKIPFFSKAHIYPGTTQKMTIGYVEEAEDEDDFSETESERKMITSDFNIIETDFYIEYTITDPIAYYYGTDNPTEVLRNCALTAIKNSVGLTDVDSAMTTGKSALEAKIHDSLMDEMANHSLGLTLGNVFIQDVEAPTEAVKAAFSKVENAKQYISERENEASKYSNEQIPLAEAAAAEIVAEANAVKTERINQANAEVAEFNTLWEQFQNSSVVREKLYYDTLMEVLPNMDIFISDGGNKMIYVTNGAAVEIAGTN